ncbi:F-box only protein 36-like [Alligator mississippiensis]|uniref:F-box only protein 36-like n=1 Tax=Alligator mississippiensis TaxID=8496 RepID=A0A151NWV0_ALLMI|nr:F-box only protein 36-like [Alligator mississippiensis]
MTSLLHDKLHETYCQAPSPSKDFHHLTITKKEVIWRTWRISFRPNQEKVFPTEVRKPHNHFLLDKLLHRKVQDVFSNRMLEYILNLCQGHYDFLVRMPDNLLIYILSFLNTDAIGQLSKTCKKFQQLCSSKAFWERVGMLQNKHSLDERMMAFPVYKKLMNLNQKHHQMQRRRTTLF